MERIRSRISKVRNSIKSLDEQILQRQENITRLKREIDELFLTKEIEHNTEKLLLNKLKNESEEN
jgi:peptidoglycan hydrolase CwlO-like protein